MNETMPERSQALTGAANPASRASACGRDDSDASQGRTPVPSHARDEALKRAHQALDDYTMTLAFERPPAPDHAELAICLRTVLALVDRGMVTIPPTTWWDAKPGDVWVLAVNGRPDAAYVFSDRRWWPVLYPGTALSDPHAITTGYRIWTTEGETS